MTVGTLVLAPTEAAPVRRNAIRRLLRNPFAMAGVAILVIAVLVALLAPLLAPFPPNATHFSDQFTPPGEKGYLLGTDDLGRDILSRIMFGLRVSLAVGLLSMVVALVVGVPLGVAAGYFRSVDGVISRFTDLLLAFPFLILAIGLTAIRGPSLGNAAFALGIAQMPGVIRVARSETLRLKALDYVAAALVDGAGSFSILWRHILPNAGSTLIVQATLILPNAILGEAVLSFLGLGIRPPQPSLGVMLADAQSYSSRAPWAAVFPGLAIILLVLAFNIVGDGLRDALDPRITRRRT